MLIYIDCSGRFMMRILMLCLMVAACVCGWGHVASAERRVALIIGNGAYKTVPELANPPRDAAAVERLLKGAGFDFVQRVDNLSFGAMRRALRDFSNEVASADVAVLFYAGHGIEVNGANYLVPTDAVL